MLSARQGYRILRHPPQPICYKLYNLYRDPVADFRPAISVLQFLGHRVILISKQPAVPEFGYAGLPKTAKPRSTSSGLFLPPVV